MPVAPSVDVRRKECRECGRELTPEMRSVGVCYKCRDKQIREEVSGGDQQ